ncbi:MAG TPA: hypothetical protein V6C97_22065 [Oculatellaceae cyanobacterium]
MQTAELIVLVTAFVALTLSVFALIGGVYLARNINKVSRSLDSLTKDCLIGASVFALFFMIIDMLCLKGGVVLEGVYVLVGLVLSLTTAVVFLALGLRIGHALNK